MPSPPEEPSTASGRVAAAVAAALLGAVAAGQVAAAAGMPVGEHLYGGRVAEADGRLPVPYRAASGSAAVLLGALALLLLARVGLVRAPGVPTRLLTTGTWAVVVLMAVNTLGNLASTSAVERWGLGSLTALVSVLAAVAARSPLPAATPASRRPRTGAVSGG